MNGCHLIPLLTRSDGLASLCAACGTVHLGFGNFMLVVARLDFPAFLRNMADTYSRRSADTDNPMVKNIVVPTLTQEVSLLFCLNELEAFIRYLELVQGKLTVLELAQAASLGYCRRMN